MAGVRASPAFVFSVLTGQQKLELYVVKNVTARWTHQSFEKQYVFRTFRAFRLRSVPLWRSTNAVLTVRLTRERAKAACTPAAVPKITRVATSTTRPFFRVLCTVAQFRPAGATLYGLRGRPRLPVRGGTTSVPNASRIAPSLV